MHTKLHNLRFFRVLALGLFAGASVAMAAPQVTTKEEPAIAKEVSFEQKLGNQVPLDLTFRDDHGTTVKLRDLVSDKPVLLSLVYYECPMLCTLVLNGVLEGIKDVPFDIGKEYTALTVSFDHEETHVLAAKKKASYVEAYGREGAEKDWHFLVGEEETIRTLTDAVGFEFKYIPETGEFAHRSGIIILTPEGVVSRYFPGIEYPSTHLRMGLVEASENKIGSLVDRLFLLCYHYDPALGQYSMVVTNVINIGCTLTVLILGGVIITLFRRERKTQQLAMANS